VIILEVSLKKALFVYLVIYIIFFSIGAFYLKTNTMNIVYNTSVIVGDRVGFDLNSDAITFGMVPSGNYASRAINIIPSNYDQSVEIFVKGNITKFLTTSESSIFIKANENRKINFDIFIPTNTSFGEYSGEIKFKITNLKLLSS
jgi:hypothetical protein